ncbi:hypothetical protein EVAR_56198_1 [Eumeta japonica]|uniref:Uncharacterized protein n=1 Tax=Eumeta variegata TaxID=151549 RepID=A0A4C1Y489_EUMVA|nr:hypothetical protein EVAR_56198_1 [Eumeta japonica]
MHLKARAGRSVCAKTPCRVRNSCALGRRSGGLRGRAGGTSLAFIVIRFRTIFAKTGPSGRHRGRRERISARVKAAVQCRACSGRGALRRSPGPPPFIVMSEEVDTPPRPPARVRAAQFRGAVVGARVFVGGVSGEREVSIVLTFCAAPSSTRTIYFSISESVVCKVLSDRVQSLRHLCSYSLSFGILRLWSLPSDTWAGTRCKRRSVNITDDDDEDGDDSVGQYHDWLNDENSNNCYDDCDD